MPSPLGLFLGIFLSNFKRLGHPYKVNFACTYRCNLRCRTCNIWRRKPGNELNLGEIEKVFSNINSRWISITGGEPFIRDDLSGVVQAIREKTNPYVLNITTNGYLTRGIVSTMQEILELGIPRILCCVSIDGPERVHDRIRGKNGSWKKAVETFGQLKSLSSRNFRVFIGYTVSGLNESLFSRTREEIGEHVSGISEGDFHFNIYHTSGHYYSNPGQNLFIKSVPEYLENSISGNGLSPLGFLTGRYVRHAGEYLRGHMTGTRCASLSASCFIDPCGDVYPCIHFSRKIGSLREEGYDINRIWHGNDAVSARGEIVNKGCPGCWTPCEAYQTIMANIFHRFSK